jgi:hypothetical protein
MANKGTPRNQYMEDDTLPEVPPEEYAEDAGAGEIDLSADEFDFSEVKEPVYELFKVGWRPAKVFEAEYGLSNASQRRQIVVTFQIERDAKPGEVKRKFGKLKTYMGLTEESRPYTVQNIKAMYPDVNLRQFNPAEVAAELVGRDGFEVNIGLQARQDGQGKQNVIKGVRPLKEAKNAYLDDV